jgi:hypothetical protein
MAFDPSHPSPIPGKSDSSWPTINQLAGIGSVIATWSWLDLGIESLLATLTKGDEMLVQALTEDLSADNRLKALRRLAITWEWMGRPTAEQTELLSEIRDIAKEVTRRKALRNKIAHGLWMRTDDEKMYRWRHHVAPLLTTESKGEVLTISQLLEFSNEIGQLARRASDAEMAARSLPPFPSPSALQGMPPVPGLASLLGPYLRRE